MTRIEKRAHAELCCGSADLPVVPLLLDLSKEALSVASMRFYRAGLRMSRAMTALMCAAASSSQLSAQEPPLRTFSSTASCSACTVEFRDFVTLTLPGDSLYIGRTTSIFRLGNGGFLLDGLGGTASPAVMDATGRFRRLIARVGQGPGEISSEVHPIARTRGDSIWIVDASRKLVFSPDAVYVREERLPLSQVGTQLVVGGDGTVVTASVVGTPEAAGYPLHVRDAAFNLRRSFGVLDPTLDPRRFAAMNDDVTIYLHRNLTPSDPASFWAYNESRFLLERYDVEGRLLARFRHALDGWYGESSRVKPSPGEFNGLALHGVQPSANQDIVWLVYHTPRPGYVKPQPGASSVWQNWTDAHDLVVEAFDSRRNEVVASGRIPQTRAFRVGYAPDVLALVRPVGDEVFSLRLVALHISRPQQ